MRRIDLPIPAMFKTARKAATIVGMVMFIVKVI
jgi:hypothetical protein